MILILSGSITNQNIKKCNPFVYILKHGLLCFALICLYLVSVDTCDTYTLFRQNASLAIVEYHNYFIASGVVLKKFGKVECCPAPGRPESAAGGNPDHNMTKQLFISVYRTKYAQNLYQTERGRLHASTVTSQMPHWRRDTSHRKGADSTRNVVRHVKPRR